MAATISATRAFFARRSGRYGAPFWRSVCPPSPHFQLAAYRRVTRGGLMLGEIIAQKVDRPPVSQYSRSGAGTVG